MIDLNTLISNALIAAVQQAVAPLNERIATLESANDILHRTQHEDMVAMRDRIAALESAISHKVQVQQANITAALAERIAALETKLTEANLFTQMVPATPTTDITQHIIDALGDIEHPLFKRLSSFMDAVAEQAMDDHCSTYDHDDYDNHIGDDDKHFEGDIEDAVRDALSNMTFDVSIR